MNGWWNFCLPRDISILNISPSSFNFFPWWFSNLCLVLQVSSKGSTLSRTPDSLCTLNSKRKVVGETFLCFSDSQGEKRRSNLPRWWGRLKLGQSVFWKELKWSWSVSSYLENEKKSKFYFKKSLKMHVKKYSNSQAGKSSRCLIVWKLMQTSVEQPSGYWQFSSYQSEMKP